MLTVPVNLAERSYPILCGSGAPAAFCEMVQKASPGGQVVFITDENCAVHALSLKETLESSGLTSELLVIAPGEGQKCQASVARLYDEMARLKADRRTLIIPVGGGVIGDLAGFVAATWNRGLPMLMVPTSLLAMVDSSVGGKVGINHPQGKNLIGAFHQPTGVWIDTASLKTLPKRELISGFAEVVKYGMILDSDFFAYLESHTDQLLERDPAAMEYIIAHSCRLKAQVVEKDERETLGVRVILNYGHTFAHAFETIAGYGEWLHGEAVSAGMICAAHLAVKRGLIPMDVKERQYRLLQKLGLPIAIPNWPTTDLIEIMRRDKKNIAGRIRLILPTKLGEVKLFDDITEDELQATLQTCRAND